MSGLLLVCRSLCPRFLSCAGVAALEQEPGTPDSTMGKKSHPFTGKYRGRNWEIKPKK
jgi:hypothetical protein